MANNTIKGAGDVYQKDLYGDLAKSATEVLPLLEAINVQLQASAKANSKFVNIEPKDISSLNQISTAVQKTNEDFKTKLALDKKISTARNQSQKERLAELKLIKDREKAFVRFETQQKRALKLALQNRKATIDSANSYKQLSKQTNTAQARFKRLAAQYGETDARTQKALVTFRRLDDRLRSINNTARDGRRDVGRYGLALNKVGATLKSGLGALGVGVGIAAVGQAFRDAFNRVREFDKELQNISGITGIAREDLKGLESEIISVAGSSIKTSNEVAQLASTLFTLGNSEREVKQLLKPVNDLSIALGATSEEAADFLGQTLNAFGKSASSGQEFADIIANVRTSTSLDFQRIKDALGFVAPTANALGLSLGEVSAQIGVLQDNGIKAARAGRLLNTSFARLVEKGLSLDDALVKINNSQDKIATATNLFGKESFTLGLILADNVDKTAELANEFDNLSEGSLKTLTDEQLKSVDAQLKILDSTYEKLILNIENGEGVLSDIFVSAISGVTKFISSLDAVSVGLSKIRKQSIGAREDLLLAVGESLGGGAFFEGFEKIANNIDKKTDEIAENFKTKDLETQKTISANLVQRIKDDNKALEGASVAESLILERRVKANLLLLSKLEVLNDEQEKNNELIVDNTGAKKANSEATAQLNGLIEKQAAVVSDLNTQIKRATTEEQILELSFELDVEKDELDRLRRIVTSSLEEISKIELNLIEDATQKRIAKENERAEKVIEAIRTNSRLEKKERLKLIREVEIDRDKNIKDFQIKEVQDAIKFEADLSRAKVEQARTGFKTEEAFEKEKAEQFKAIRKNELDEEIKFLESQGRERDKLRIEQLKAEREGLNELGKEFKGLGARIGEIVQVIGEEIDKVFERRIERISEKLARTSQNIDRLREKATEGQLASEESLAFEQKQEIELARQKEREQKRQQRTQAFFSVLSSFQANDGDLPKTIADISVLRALAGTLTGFWDGTDDVGKSLGKGQLSGRDGHIVRVDGSEQVWSKADRSEVKNRTRNEIKDIVGMYDKGFMMDIGNPAEFINPSSFTLNGMSMKGVESKLDELNKTMKSIEPIQDTMAVDEVRKLLKHVSRKGNKTKTTFSKLY